MSNQTIKKDPNNRGHNELEARLRSIWLHLVQMFRQKYYLPIINISREISIAKGYLDTASPVLFQA